MAITKPEGSAEAHRVLRSRAPARIDLAGGTLDLWPLHLFFDQATTLNCAINQFATAEITVEPETKIGGASSISFGSLDRSVEASFRSYGDLLEEYSQGWRPAKLRPELWLHARVTRHFFSLWRRSGNLKLTTKCDAPAGAGLGGSSALNIALCRIFQELAQTHNDSEAIIAIARDLETTVIEVPAGVQDYYSAEYGGVQALRLDSGKISRKVFYKQNEFIESHLILCYTGHSRNSGINNWAVYKGFIDKNEEIRQALKKIVEATKVVELGLERQSYTDFVRGIDLEWTARQTLAPAIATPQMLEIMSRAKALGCEATKVCGAGGGGCFILVAPSEKRSRISERLKQEGVHVIDFKVENEGCQVNG